jgi:hypothetical protein
MARCLFTMAALATGFAASAQEPVTAVFKAREIDFVYRSSTAFYPCHELRNVVTNVLRAVGARDDVQVRVSNCEYFVEPQESTFDRWDPTRLPDEGFRNRRTSREQLSHIRARLMAPVAVTPEVLAEIDRDKSRRELVSRVTGNPATAMNDPIVFEAKRQAVTLSRTSLRLEPEDCELLEQMTRSVFRELDVRVVRGNSTCDSRQPSRMAPQLTVEALLPTGALLPMPVKEEGKPAPQAPAPAENENESPDPPSESPAQ